LPSSPWFLSSIFPNTTEESAEITGSPHTVSYMGSINFITQPLLCLLVHLFTGAPLCPLLQSLRSLRTQTKTEVPNCSLIPTAHLPSFLLPNLVPQKNSILVLSCVLPCVSACEPMIKHIPKHICECICGYL
jgi:hypothetical protein